MSKPFSSIKFKSLLPYFLFAVGIIIAYKVVNEIDFFANIFSTIWKIITPFFYGFLLAYIVNVPYSGIQGLLGKSKIKFFQKRKKILSSILTILIISFVIFLFLYLLIPYIYRIGSFFISSLPSYYARVLQYVNYLNDLEVFGINISPEGILAMLQEFIQNINIENLLTPLNALFGVSSAIFTGFLAIISAIYILIEKEKFKMFLSRLIAVFAPPGINNAIMEYTGRLNKNFKRYIYIQTIDGCILGGIVIIELLILRSPYAIILGLMLGIVNYVPYFGSIIGSLIVVVIVAFTQDIAIAGIAAVILLVTQQIDGNFIQPKLMGGSFALSPFLIIVSITIGGAAAGMLGMIAAIPIVAVLKDMLENIIIYYERKKLDMPKE